MQITLVTVMPQVTIRLIPEATGAQQADAAATLPRPVCVKPQLAALAATHGSAIYQAE